MFRAEMAERSIEGDRVARGRGRRPEPEPSINADGVISLSFLAPIGRWRHQWVFAIFGADRQLGQTRR